MAQFSKYIKKQPWYEPMRRLFWSNPDRLLAIKTVFVIALLSIPFVAVGKPFYAITLSLGALAGALSETDDHPKGRIKSMALKLFSFAFSSLSIELLQNYPVLQGIGLCLATIVLILTGGISERYRGVTFGTLLVGIYAMIGAEISPAWYIQPIFLTLGALIYGLFSLLLLYIKPWRLLEEQLANGFMALAKYYEEKAKLFPSDKITQKNVRTKLSLLNVQTVKALDSCKDVLNSYGDAINNENKLKPYLHYFMVLQSLHERAASSHERYDLLSNDTTNHELLEGIGQTMYELSHAAKGFAESLLMRTKYKHPSSLEWIINTLNDLLIQYKIENIHPLVLLVNNLSRSNSALKNIEKNKHGGLAPRLEKDTRSFIERLKNQLNINHSRMRYALRLSLAFAVGFTISELFNVAKGEWIVLTILFVLQPNYSETRRRLFERTLGTVSGVLIGIFVVQLLTPAGQLFFMLTSAFLFMIWMKKRYSIGVIFITTFVLFAFNLISQKGVEIMLPRLIDTIIGAVIAFGIVRILWPDWQSKRLPHLLNEALIKNTAYFKAITEAYRNFDKATDDDLNYRVARREAHRADNALVTTWQNMQLEPRKQQQFRQQSFKLTYLNHALVSYLSAFGAHRFNKSKPHSDVLSYVNSIFDVLNKASENNEEQAQQNNQKLRKIINEIRLRLKEDRVETTRQQFILLYNIAEVTEHLLNTRNSF